MNGEMLLQTGGLIGGLVAAGQLGLSWVRYKRGGEQRRGQAEAAKAHLDVAQAEASLPHIQESLKLGNVSEAVAIQQGVINGLRDHVTWQDAEIEDGKRENAILRGRLEERDQKIAELEKRLGDAEKALNTAKRLIGELRQTSREENGSPS